MEITVKINGRMVTVEVSTEVAEYMDAGRRKTENLSHEKRRHWDDREFDEYIVATEGRLSYQPTPEDIICQRETLVLLLSILDNCTAIQRERFLLYALYEYTYDEIGAMYGCSKYAVRDSIEAVRKIFKKYLKIDPTNGP
ncbi:MAG: sigma-70 family RNA polymerase sigma factor [Oscillospiraceae bacterium]|nr:sigma-70 family RNA polymerase sigma factor [Oscillospiraceae bacterium]